MRHLGARSGQCLPPSQAPRTRKQDTPAVSSISLLRVTWSVGARAANREVVKLALTRPAVVLLERTERWRHDRAAALAIREVFPAVQQLRFELTFESTTTSTPTAQSHVLHPPARAFFEFCCPYSDCDGRFDLKRAVNAAVADPTHRAEGVLECCGARARDRGLKRPCQLSLMYNIIAIYQRDM